MKAIYPMSAAVLIAIILGGWYLWPSRTSAPAGTAEATGTQTPPALPPQYEVPGQKTFYKDQTLGFYFEVPAGFTATEYVKDTPGPEILVVNADYTKAIDIRIKPWSDTGPVTEQSIEADQPDVDVLNPTPITVGGCPGLSFNSTNPKWENGNGYGIWFVCHGYRFWLTTDRDLTDLDRALAATWVFN